MKQVFPEDYFDDIYRNNEDPWDYETSDYEKEKYASTIAALPKPFYNNALEIGCSIGVLTEMLNEKCDRLLSIDASSIALQRAKKRLQNLPTVTFEKRAVPDEFPEGSYDLIVVSEVAYYLPMEDLVVLKKKITNSLTQNGDLILVHWLPAINDFPLTGDDVHDFFNEPDASFKNVYQSRKELYRIDVFTKLTP